jgi:hypothetical protein
MKRLLIALFLAALPSFAQRAEERDGIFDPVMQTVCERYAKRTRRLLILLIRPTPVVSLLRERARPAIGGTSAHPRRGPADRGQHRQAPGSC